MISFQDLPELGVGLIYWPRFRGLVRLDELPIDVIEVEPQPFWFPPATPSGPFRVDHRAFEHLRELPQRKLVHGVGFPIGGTVAPDTRQIEPFVESIELLDAPWASEHLSFNRVRHGDGGEIDVGFLLPPLQSRAGVAVAEHNISVLKEYLPVPLAFETGVSYLKPLPGELSDGAFFSAVATTADCGILLDLHNLWANERNGRQRLLDVIDNLPLDRVVELHLAGGDEYDGYWVDAHSGLIPPEVMDLARSVVPRLPNLKAIIYEVMPEYLREKRISQAQLGDQFLEMHELWDIRGSNVAARHDTREHLSVQTPGLPAPHEWEATLADAVTRKIPSAAAGLPGILGADPGVAVLHDLVGAVRAGKVADTLTLTTRLLLLTLGEHGFRQLLEEFWNTVPSEQMASDEAANFAAYLTNTSISDRAPHLPDVTSFELASHEVLMTNEPRTVHFAVDPGPLLSSLRQGVLPSRCEPGDFELVLTPPSG